MSVDRSCRSRTEEVSISKDVNMGKCDHALLMTDSSTKKTSTRRETKFEIRLEVGVFTWVFFLASKDETIGILKNFITEIENLVDKKQNGVAERRNKTLIEAAKTMLADSKLPTTFWAEAVNTACYVHNRVIIVKPHNKTPYELFRGKTLALSFMRLFGCHVTILNTLDHLVKFDGESDDGFFVGYSLTSKAFRVYNIRTRKVEENLHIRFLENKPIVTGSEESNGAGHISKETEFSQDYIVMPLWKYGSMFDSSSKNSSDDEPQPSSIAEKKDDEGVSKASVFCDQEQLESSTLNINTAGPSINTASANFKTGSLNINNVSPTVITTRSNRYQNVSDMFSLGRSATHEATHADLFGDEIEMDMSNLTTSYQVHTTPNTRIHKDHSLDHVIDDIQSGVQTRGMTKNTNEHGFISAVYEWKTHKDLYTLEAMQEELLQFKLQKVWILVDLPKGIDYDEFFPPVARIEAIRLFLAYTSFMGFMVYQMDVKSAFLYGTTEEEVYVCQPPGFEDPDYLDKVYMVVKALYGLHQAPRAWYGTLAKYLLDNGFQRGKIDQTLFIKKQKRDILLVQDSDGDDVDVHLHRSMIGSLMYVTSSRPDIMFAVCAYSRFQVTPKVSHSHAVKMIFSDYAGASLDRKSTTGGCQFLGCRLISWQCKKQTVVATSSTEAEYVAAASCYGQDWLDILSIWQIKRGWDTKIPQSSGPPKKVGDEAVHKELGDKMERAATTASCLEAEQDNDFCDKHNMVAYLQKSEGSEGFYQIVDFLNTCHIKYALIKNPTIYVSLIEQFWQTATARTLKNGDMEITATIDGKVKIVSESSIRLHLKLEDSDGISTLPTIVIFEQLALMGKQKRLLLPHQRTYIAPSLTQKLFSNMKWASMGYTGVDTLLFQTMFVQGQILQGEGSTIPETEVPQLSSPTQTHVADEAASTGVDHRHRGAATTVSGLEAGHGSGNIHKTPTIPHDSPLLRVHTLGSDEGRMQPNELMELVTKLSDRVAVLENDLKQTKKTYGAAFTKLIKKEKDSFNQGRKIAKIDENPDISLVQQMIHHDAQTQGSQEYNLEPNFEFTAPKEVYTAEPNISTANVTVITASAEVSTAAESLVYTKWSAAKRKEKGKAIVEESEPAQTKTKIQQEPERLGFEEAQRL
ncbi:putative ribonuclease H-like domain-containing protein [Tanacetum coccineum]